MSLTSGASALYPLPCARRSAKKARSWDAAAKDSRHRLANHRPCHFGGSNAEHPTVEPELHPHPMKFSLSISSHAHRAWRSPVP